MRKTYHLFFTAVAALAAAACSNPTMQVESIGMMPGMESGYELGVSACYVATANNHILLTGGCNFPETPAAEGGAKRYYKGIYVSPTDAPLQWAQVGELPESSAYGVSLQQGNSLIIAGGMNNEGALNSVYMLTPKANGCEIKDLPSLPCTVDNAAGAVSGNRLYVVGGNADGKASARVFMLDMTTLEKGWSELKAFPGNGRVQPVCAATSEALYVWGGFTPKSEGIAAKVHCDGMKHDFATETWSPLPEVTDESGNPLTLSGGTAIADGTKIFVAGGVNREIFEDAISGTYRCIPQKEYLLQPAAWYQFNHRLMCYDTVTGSWSVVMKDHAFARAGAILTKDGNTLFYTGGELKPGIRTPEIVKVSK